MNKIEIKEFVKSHNLTQSDLAEIACVGVGTVQSYTYSVARHTYATYLINNGISILTVSKALGHSNTKMSEHYAKLLGKTVINEMSKLM